MVPRDCPAYFQQGNKSGDPRQLSFAEWNVYVIDLDGTNAAICFEFALYVYILRPEDLLCAPSGTLGQLRLQPVSRDHFRAQSRRMSIHTTPLEGISNQVNCPSFKQASIRTSNPTSSMPQCILSPSLEHCEGRCQQNM